MMNPWMCTHCLGDLEKDRMSGTFELVTPKPFKPMWKFKIYIQICICNIHAYMQYIHTHMRMQHILCIYVVLFFSIALRMLSLLIGCMNHAPLNHAPLCPQSSFPSQHSPLSRWPPIHSQPSSRLTVTIWPENNTGQRRTKLGPFRLGFAMISRKTGGTPPPKSMAPSSCPVLPRIHPPPPLPVDVGHRWGGSLSQGVRSPTCKGIRTSLGGGLGSPNMSKFYFRCFVLKFSEGCIFFWFHECFGPIGR